MVCTNIIWVESGALRGGSISPYIIGAYPRGDLRESQYKSTLKPPCLPVQGAESFFAVFPSGWALTISLF